MRQVLFGLLALGASACSPFNPDLGDDPFLCGTTEPRCPDGYAPIAVSSVRCECHRANPGVDAGPSPSCNVDSVESNDTLQSATLTNIGASTTDNYNNLTICPVTDKDYFSMNITRVGAVITVDVVFTVGGQAPTVDILNQSGVTVHPTIAAGQPGHVTATFTTTASGTYFALVTAGTPPATLQYSLHLTVT